jgi:hypothetical protein
MMMAEVHSCVAGKWWKVMAFFALASVALYVIVVVIGAFLAVEFRISYELLIFVATPSILIFFVLNGWRYYAFRDGMDLALLGRRTWLSITLGRYFLYRVRDITQELWARGVWFSENDVLHMG